MSFTLFFQEIFCENIFILLLLKSRVFNCDITYLEINMSIKSTHQLIQFMICVPVSKTVHESTVQVVLAPLTKSQKVAIIMEHLHFAYRKIIHQFVRRPNVSSLS